MTVDSAASSHHHAKFDEQMGRVFAVQHPGSLDKALQASQKIV
jgi:hypothetical protein